MLLLLFVLIASLLGAAHADDLAIASMKDGVTSEGRLSVMMATAEYFLFDTQYIEGVGNELLVMVLLVLALLVILLR